MAEDHRLGQRVFHPAARQELVAAAIQDLRSER
jgi:hypothetical protein